MTRRRDQAGGAESDVPQEYAELAQRLTAHLTAPTFDPAVKAQQLYRLRAMAAAQPAPVIERKRPRVLRWPGLGRRVIGTAAASLAVLTLSTSAVAAASSEALPGEPLYGTKLLIGRVRLATAVSDEAKVAVLMDQAQHRLDEIDALRERDADPALFAQALESFRAHVQDAEGVAGDDEQLQRRVMEEAREDSSRLQALPEPSDPAVQRTLQEAQRQASLSAAGPSGASGAPEQGKEPEAPEGPSAEPGPAPAPPGDSGDEDIDSEPGEEQSPPADPADESPGVPSPPMPPGGEDSEPPPQHPDPRPNHEPDPEPKAEWNSESDARGADEASEVKDQDKKADRAENEEKEERKEDKEEPKEAVKPPEQPTTSS